MLEKSFCTAVEVAIHMVISMVAQSMVMLTMVQNMVEGKNHMGSHVVRFAL